ncbi:outer membrane protein assembly factor BamD [Sulfurospirillum sp. 1612]|uniref:outer membrane protein assembly factor BamD n=1 Tax=Sulfurospirillum sp. 1612 TaxID=3094835 RepID=UPI002F931A1C
MKMYKILLLVTLIVFVTGCSTKEKVAIYNKPALYWYNSIIKEVKNQDLEKADDYFTSLSSEHVESPLLPTSMLMLAHAHMQEEEYILANFYLDEYIKRFGNAKNTEYARFLKMKANFDSFLQPGRNQQLLLDTIQSTKAFVKRYPNSKFRPMVDTMLVKLELANFQLTEETASLYGRLDKPKAKKIYDEKIQKSPLKDAKMIKPHVSWFRSLFE